MFGFLSRVLAPDPAFLFLWTHQESTESTLKNTTILFCKVPMGQKFKKTGKTTKEETIGKYLSVFLIRKIKAKIINGSNL